MQPGRLRIVADSRWLASRASASSLFAKLPIEAIHYSLDLETFAPRNRAAARSVLDLPQDARILLFVADHPKITRKGFATLAEALAILSSQREVFLLSMGRDTPKFTKPFAHKHLGYVNEEQYQSIIYSAADIFVIPSLQEAFGQTALESMACGTPVVGSDAGGIPELVRDGVTGLLFPAGDPRALAEALGRLIESEGLRAAMGAEARRMAMREYSIEIQARRYSELYARMLETGAQPA
ncbi:MAG TPA: glycosyltransferase [Candidatus Acidoferrum sp.]|nr:glycosyltransferase [Candidatus Acidoferrum sp.]